MSDLGIALLAIFSFTGGMCFEYLMNKIFNDFL